MARIGKQSPWITYYDKIELLFEEDPQVRVLYDDDAKEIRLYAETADKASALARLIPAEQKFGNITLKTKVAMPNVAETGISMPDIAKALYGNPIVEDIKIISGIFPNPIVYVLFRKEVVQYFNDDLGDANGLCSTLYQEIAKDVFTEQKGVFFCTSPEDIEEDFEFKAQWP